MKMLIITTCLLAATSFASTKCHAQEKDSIAVGIIKRSLKIIADDIADTVLPRPVVPNMPALISFLTDLTGVPSESDGNWDGQHSPTENDLRNWSIWLRLNEGNIYWDVESKTILVKKKMQIPGMLMRQLVD
jgi:hypothetical protein